MGFRGLKENGRLKPGGKLRSFSSPPELATVASSLGVSFDNVRARNVCMCAMCTCVLCVCVYVRIYAILRTDMSSNMWLSEVISPVLKVRVCFAKMTNLVLFTIFDLFDHICYI